MLSLTGGGGGGRQLVDPCFQGEQGQMHVEDVNQMHVKDEKDVKGNVNINDDTNDTLSVEEEFLDAKESLRMLIMILIHLIHQL